VTQECTRLSEKRTSTHIIASIPWDASLYSARRSLHELLGVILNVLTGTGEERYCSRPDKREAGSKY
jgi:hypothetical protein